MITGLRCLVAVARHHGINLHIDQDEVALSEGEGDTSAVQLVRLAKANGLRAKRARLSWRDLARGGSAFPFMIRRKDGSWLIVSGFRPGSEGEDEIVVIDPEINPSEFRFIGRTELAATWDGDAVLVKRSFRWSDADRPFDFRWFLGEMWQQRHLMRDIALAAVLLYLLGIAIPIYFQIVVDKVLVHHAYATLYVLTAGVIAAALFEALFTFLRRYLILHLSNKIDIRLATRTVAHLMRLPIDFFERAPAGVLVKHMQQGDKIREFLAGRLFLTLVDSTALLVFIPVLFLYSVRLTVIVLIFATLVAGTVALMVGPFKRRLRELYEIEARRQSLLVEAIHGMATVKSLALERRHRDLWNSWSAEAIGTRYRVGLISAFAQTSTSGLEKLMIIAIVGFGTQLVFNDAITVGTLIAFQMLSGRVSGPLSQLVGLIHEYQDASLSVRMLGNVMNAKPERSGQRGITPVIRGEITFSDVVFRYDPMADPALDHLTVSIPAGTIFGIVGRSGSGKTTLTRLIRGLYQPQSGVVRLDGHDLRNIDLHHLRTRIGVVLQDSFLFRGTVRENIAIARPSAPFEEIVAAAQTAGADEFIERMPQGFDTPLDENASNLSGGQRQRLAIARALIASPPVLILDEATSALDPDSEFLVRQNLRRIARGRTLIIVSHRLTSLADAANILVLERGSCVGLGPHHELMRTCEVYRTLWEQQSRAPA
jgi:ATP-binding cassette, subfamily B, bacterial HlyB/CyaB